jgi:hypothetical protein
MDSNNYNRRHPARSKDKENFGGDDDHNRSQTNHLHTYLSVQDPCNRAGTQAGRRGGYDTRQIGTHLNDGDDGCMEADDLNEQAIAGGNHRHMQSMHIPESTVGLAAKNEKLSRRGSKGKFQPASRPTGVNLQRQQSQTSQGIVSARSSRATRQTNG